MKISELPEGDPAEILTDEETIAAYLAEAERDADPAVYQRALDTVARARAKNEKSDPATTSKAASAMDWRRRAGRKPLGQSR
ncbi:DNA-binding phage protein [Paraburkholderia bannensis]|uniref:DNA-binding phage protein n=1 Tax=Paraburkholderia bannensis TaxID=765414 RepID=A0A7W9TSR0_9BURK|nr:MULTISPECIES: hypothetical protein [Paraburkholderia]MBB3255455.1 DNA-binding phage protein [Paraburkholderia sp. WP4_3_2]MBB6100534.1 DNA-binding phage protein [Paraburkholderia bannensis]